MFRSVIHVIVASAMLAACSNDSEVPRAVAVAMSAPATTADKEILVASNPSGAILVLKGAKVGETPMKLLVRGDTNVILEKEGYVQQALLITPKSEPNMVVTLVPLDDEESAQNGDDEAEQEEAASGTGTTGKKKSIKKNTGGTEPAPSTDTGEEEKNEEVVASPPSTSPEPKTKKPSYNTMAQIKRAIREGKITKAEFRMYQVEIRRKRAAEVDATKKAYQQGTLTKAQYNEKIRSIKIKYEG
jgi:hypothetical protein